MTDIPINGSGPGEAALHYRLDDEQYEVLVDTVAGERVMGLACGRNRSAMKTAGDRRRNYASCSTLISIWKTICCWHCTERPFFVIPKAIPCTAGNRLVK